MLIDGMIIAGNPEGDHFEAVAIGTPDKRSQQECRNLGKRMAQLVNPLPVL